MPELTALRPMAATIELLGALVVAYYALRALPAALLHGRIRYARCLVADGVLVALGFKLAATVLNTMLLATWRSLGVAAVILVLRTGLKQLFAWERAQLVE